MSKISILIVDDNKLLRKAHAHFLKRHSRFEIVGECENGAEAVTMAQKLKPQIILMDINMPVLNGIEATKKIHDTMPECRIIGLSAFAEIQFITSLRKNGACGYVIKHTAHEHLLKAIDKVSGGGEYFIPSSVS